MKNLFSISVPALLVVAMILPGVTTARAPDKEAAIYSFKGRTDEGFPYAGLVFDAAGNLYGTTCGGGSSSYYGTAFKLSPMAGGQWIIDVLHVFAGGTDGACPKAGLIFDKSDNLYGTTTAGGNLTYCGGLGCGTVFKLSRTSQGWEETVLYSFTDGSDGGHPYASLVFDAKGNLYGTTHDGGDLNSCPSVGCGAIFELQSQSNGRFKEHVLYAFTNIPDGGYPYSNLIFDKSGNLYGTTAEGGLFAGTVFKLTRGAGGWQESTLYNFTDGSDGGAPVAGLTMDTQGNLYGTASSGGLGNGVVFELVPGSSGWTENVLYAFNGNNDGRLPEAGVIFDGAGNIYGTNSYGGTNQGTVFELSPGSQGWSETILYSFTGGKDGGQPRAGVIFDNVGNLYGTASIGGALGWGCVFEVRAGAPFMGLRNNSGTLTSNVVFQVK